MLRCWLAARSICSAARTADSVATTSTRRLIRVRVLVTGGAGFIGSHTVDGLLRQGHQVRILDALLPPVHGAQSLPDYVPKDDVEVIFGDVRRRACWEQALQDVE